MRTLQWHIARTLWAFGTLLFGWENKAMHHFCTRTIWPEGYSREHPQWEWLQAIEERVDKYRYAKRCPHCGRRWL